MSKFIKKTTKILLATLAIASLQVTAFAGVDNHDNHDHSKKLTTLVDNSDLSEDDGIQPLKEVACEGYNGDHQMYARGPGYLVRINSNGSKSTVFKNGYAYQCRKCNTVVVTQYNAVSYKLGYYGIYNPGYTIPVNGTVLQTKNVHYSSGKTLSGFNFRYS